jgi:hypothetical protein
MIKSDEERWSWILKEAEELCEIHGSGIADFVKCRDFARRLSLLLEAVEDTGNSSLADRVMDLMAGCSPKVGSHCENSMATKERLIHLSRMVKAASKLKG